MTMNNQTSEHYSSKTMTTFIGVPIKKQDSRALSRKEPLRDAGPKRG